MKRNDKCDSNKMPKYLDLIYKKYAENPEKFSEVLCRATVSLLIACNFGKTAQTEDKIFFNYNGKTFVVGLRQTTVEDNVPEHFE